MTVARCWPALVAAVMVLLSGCSAAHSDSSSPDSRTARTRELGTDGVPPAAPPIIAVVPKSLDNPIFLDTKEAAQREGKLLGVHIDWVGPYTTDTGRQIEIVHSLIEHHVNGILISCNNPMALESVIDEGIAEGVKIATFDSDSPGSKRLFYVGTNNAALGVAAARTLEGVLRARDLVPPDARKSRPLTAVIISGRREALNLDERISSFKASTKELGLRLRFLPTLYSDDSIGRAIDLTGQVTDDRPEPKVIFFTGGWLFYAPIESIKDYAAWIHAGGIAVTIDATYPILMAEKQGLVQGVIGQDFREMGRIGVKMLYRAMRGESYPKVIYTEIERVTPHNLPKILRTTSNYEIR